MIKYPTDKAQSAWIGLNLVHSKNIFHNLPIVQRSIQVFTFYTQYVYIIFIIYTNQLLYICPKMQSSEKLCLKWNDFHENLNSAFGVLRNDKEFSDVTLACEDGTQVEAHKVILASSSPFFMEILKRNKHPHPLIYMRGIKAEALTAIVDFLYFGEANVVQENLDAFLALAEELKLKGLTGSTEHNELKHLNEESSQKNIAQRKQHKESIRNMPTPMDIRWPQIDEECSSEMPVARWSVRMSNSWMSRSSL